MAKVKYSPGCSVLRMRDLTGYVGLSKSEIYRRIPLAEFPRGIRLGARSTGWRVIDIDEWLAKREVVSLRKAA